MLAAKNREVVDPIANRYSFIEDPVEITVTGAPEKEVELHLHPDQKKGGRSFRVTEKYLLRKSDFQKINEGDVVRLKDNLTLTKKRKGLIFLDNKMPEQKGFLNISWLPAENNIPIEIMMDDGTVKRGYAEHNITTLEVDDLVQFERFGFCRLDRKDPYVFWYAHD